MKLIIEILVVLMMQVLTVLLDYDKGLFIPEYSSVSDPYYGEDSNSTYASGYRWQVEMVFTPSQIRGPPGMVPS